MGDWIVEPVSLLGAFAVFLLSLLETVFPSIPAELIMPVPVYRAAPGEIDLPGAIVGVTFGLLLGAWIPVPAWAQARAASPADRAEVPVACDQAQRTQPAGRMRA